jgi:hypothetical protein
MTTGAQDCRRRAQADTKAAFNTLLLGLGAVALLVEL